MERNQLVCLKGTAIPCRRFGPESIFPVRIKTIRYKTDFNFRITTPFMNDNRLVIISYRLPFSFQNTDGAITVKSSAGGLVTAMKSLDLSEAKQKPVWIGCADFPRKTWEKYRHLLNDDFEYVPVFLDKKTNNDFYNGFANSVLWPLFHYFPAYVDYQDGYFTAYRKANEAVAETVAELLQPQDLVWVHDYHFMGLPRLSRERSPEATIGFFLHIPFPSYELIRILPRKSREYLLTGLLGADLVGFHTNEYNIHFLESVQFNLGVHHKVWKITYQNRLIQSGSFPVGINYALFNDAYDKEEVVAEREKLQDAYRKSRILFSVDRLDYTKGVMQRLDAYAWFLENYPEFRERLVFILVVVPSRDVIAQYGERKQLIEQAVGRINGKYGSLTWLPIVYQYGSVSSTELSALYSACDVALITPIRDGMNLVAKEFVASRRDRRGVLILSEMTGAATELGDALLINPLDEAEIGEQLKVALEMPPEEQERRLEAMQQRIQGYDVRQWARDFIDSLLNMQQTQQQGSAQLLRDGARFSLLERYQQARSRLLLLDYDGTLVGFAPTPEEARPSAEVVRLLEQLAAQPENKVVIISGRDRDSLNEWFGHLPIDMVAEHGASLRQEGVWRQDSLDDGAWKTIVQPVLDEFVSRCPGSFVEEKSHSLAWHYRNSDEETGFTRSRELISTLGHLLPATLRVLDGNRVIEVKSTETDKGKVARQLALAYPYEFVLAIGDDRTDEDMFVNLTQPNEYTIKVGRGSTSALYRLNGVGDVLSLLRELGRGVWRQAA